MDISDLVHDEKIVNEAGKLFIELIAMASSTIKSNVDNGFSAEQTMFDVNELATAFVFSTPPLVLSNVVFNLLVNAIRHKHEDFFATVEAMQNTSDRDYQETIIKALIEKLATQYGEDESNTDNRISDIPHPGLYL
jgi:hypothetical protein